MARTATVRRRARGATRKVEREARHANREVRELAMDRRLTSLARLGYVVRGALYGAMGALALALALGAPVATTDQRGVLALAGPGWLAVAVMLVAIVGLAAYSLWGFARAVYDPLGRGDSPAGVAARIGFAWSGLNYAALCVFAAGFLAGSSRRADDGSVPRLVDRVLSLPAGHFAVVVAGMVGLAGGLAQFADAYRAGFKKDVKRTRMTAAERRAVDTLGRVGMVARGVIFTLLAWFILQAGLTRDAGRARGMGATFRALEAAPVGRLLLTLVALGFIALGFHSIMNARWVRTPEP